jgi:hypothetical protein
VVLLLPASVSPTRTNTCAHTCAPTHAYLCTQRTHRHAYSLTRTRSHARAHTHALTRTRSHARAHAHAHSGLSVSLSSGPSPWQRPSLTQCLGCDPQGTGRWQPGLGLSLPPDCPPGVGVWPLGRCQEVTSGWCCSVGVHTGLSLGVQLRCSLPAALLTPSYRWEGPGHANP